jgi:hypothetical protein
VAPSRYMKPAPNKSPKVVDSAFAGHGDDYWSMRAPVSLIGD